jgi:hypothetical protein
MAARLSSAGPFGGDSPGQSRAGSTQTTDVDSAGGEAAPLLYLPQSRYPAGATILVDGEAVEFSIHADTQRSLIPWDESPGSHEIVVTPT